MYSFQYHQVEWEVEGPNLYIKLKAQTWYYL